MNDSKNVLFISLSIIVAGVIIAGAIIFSKNGGGPALPQVGDQNNQGQGQPVVRKDVTEGENNPSIGDKKAPIVMIEFSDFQCPFCKRFIDDAYTSIKKEYIAKGLVRIVFRDFPLSNIHPDAQKASEGARCALEQGKWEAMHDKIFAEQAGGVGVERLKQFAKDVKLDTKKFNECLDSGKTKTAVENNFNDGVKFGVQGTPSFFVNGEMIVGAQPFSVFKAKFDALLAEKK